MNSIKVSVIIPCYNVEEFLPYAVKMLQKQTFSDFEVIFVDDCSKDNTFSMLQTLALEDSRFKVVKNKKNQSAGFSRNVGLSMAQGDYIIFLDADDFYSVKLLEIVYNKAIETNVDIVFFNSISYDENKKDFDNKPLTWLFNQPFPINEIFSPSDILDNALHFCLGVPWNKLYKKSFVLENKLQFQNIKKHNDSLFTLSAQILAKSMIVIDETLIAYRINHPDSITKRYEKDRKKYSKIVLKELKTLLKKRKLYEKYRKAYEICERYDF